MRKQIVTNTSDVPEVPGAWLDLERLASVEVSSEDPSHPIEGALLPNGSTPLLGWRAAEPGAQLIRLRFDEPQRIRRIQLRIDDVHEERTQELLLRWSGDGGTSLRDIVRQQWTFSPAGATSEREDYAVDLHGVCVLELTLVPHIGGGESRATLAELRLA